VTAQIEFNDNRIRRLLWDALWLMLAYDLSMQRLSVGICENPKCGREYVADRSKKRYCSAACAQRSASLRYHHRKGKNRRATSRPRTGG
jgi:CGNR zinc finger